MQMPGNSIYLPQGYNYYWYDEVDSTNLEALRKRREGLHEDSWFCAKRQTEGRGTRGRVWISHSGNLYASLLTRVSCAADNLSQISIVAALATMNAIETSAKNDLLMGELCLKWPNDILLNGKKIAGILIETRLSIHRDQFDIVIGTGINLTNHPELASVCSADDLHSAGWECTREQLFVALVQSSRDWLSIWSNGRGFGEVRRSWLEHSCHIGRTLIIKVGDDHFEGRFKSITGNGALVLEDLSGIEHKITSGSIIEIKT